MDPVELTCIVVNAFNGPGDTTGSEEYGTSAAWIDLQDFVEAHELEGLPTGDSDALSTILIAYNQGKRYAIAYMNHESGTVNITGYATQSEMRADWQIVVTGYTNWEREN